MSIVLKNISKYYGKQKALDQVSFEISKGEVVGFLGPNGAGKSTSMKIISAYLEPSQGQVLVNGLSVQEHSLEVRKQLGYLPENNPLYHEMYVKEFLAFVSNVHQLDQINKRIADVIEKVGLGKEKHKKIGALSKGYKQRVGIAQAIIHDPGVLILDEPTSGLDPNQIIEIRELIKSLGKDKTVLMSTHIMQEVEAICSRVIIINQGKIVMNDQKETIKNAGLFAQVVEVEFSSDVSKKMIENNAWIHKVHQKSPRIFVLFSESTEDIRPLVFQWAVSQNISVLEMKKQEGNLEDIFKGLTGS